MEILKKSLKFLRIIILGLTTNIFFISKSFAYIDPGTGTIIIQAIIGLIATISTTIYIYFQEIKSFFKNLKNRKKIK